MNEAERSKAKRARKKAMRSKIELLVQTPRGRALLWNLLEWMRHYPLLTSQELRIRRQLMDHQRPATITRSSALIQPFNPSPLPDTVLELMRELVRASPSTNDGGADDA